MSPDSWLSILLTCITVVLAVLAIIIAIAAVWGFSGIKDHAEKKATECAREEIERYFKTEGLSEDIKEQIRRLVNDEIDAARAAQGILAAFPMAAEENSGTDKPIEEYPKEGGNADA